MFRLFTDCLSSTNSPKRKDEFKLELSPELKTVADRYVTAGFHFAGKNIFVTSDNKKNHDSNAKRILICDSKEIIKEVSLTSHCDFVYKIDEKLLLCGGIGQPAVIVDMELGRPVRVIFKDLLLRSVAFAPIGDNKCVIISKQGHKNNLELIEYDKAKCDLRMSHKIMDGMHTICGSLSDPTRFLICFGKNATEYRYTPPSDAEPNGIIQKLNSMQIPISMSFGMLEPKPSYLNATPRANGGYVFRDHTSRSIVVTDEEGEAIATWNPMDRPQKKLGKNFEIDNLHVLSDDNTFIVNFADSRNLNKIGVIQMPANKSNILQFHVYEISEKIAQLAIDEENQRLIVITKTGNVQFIEKFKPIVEMHEKDRNALEALPFNRGVVEIVRQYWRGP